MLHRLIRRRQTGASGFRRSCICLSWMRSRGPRKRLMRLVPLLPPIGPILRPVRDAVAGPAARKLAESPLPHPT